MQRPVSPDRLVLAGFGALLILMGALAVDSARQIRDVSATSSRLRKGSRDRDTLLDQLRTDTYRSATLVRDYVLEQDDVHASRQKNELVTLRSRVDDALTRYAAMAPAPEADAIQSLKQHAEIVLEFVGAGIGLERLRATGRGRTISPDRRRSQARRTGPIREAGQRARRTDTGCRGRADSVYSGAIPAPREHDLHARPGFGLHSGNRRIPAREAPGQGSRRSRFDQVCKAREDLKRLSDRLLAVQEEERRSLSRELHDDLGQTMSAMLIELRNADCRLVASRRDELASVRRLAEENVAKIRNMALLLRPAMLDELGLVPALRWHVREVGRRTGLKVKADCRRTKRRSSRVQPDLHLPGGSGGAQQLRQALPSQ